MRNIFFVLLLLATAYFLVGAEETQGKRRTKKKGPIIGIDLGTTYSCVSIYRNGKVEIIPNLDGDRTTPSVVSWDKEGKILIGRAAKNNAAANPSNTFYDVKRLIGRKISEVLKKDAKLLSYELTKKEGDKRVYIKRTTEEGRTILFTPEQISSFVLDYLKRSAEEYLGEEVEEAVITVPAYFNDQQRTATKDAGRIAGLNVKRIINEPTAASMTYGLDKLSEHNILVFDLGGGTFDVSLLNIEEGMFQVRATSGDMHLGGEDFDLKIVEYFSEIWKKKTGLNLLKDSKAFQRLKGEVEKAKIRLSGDNVLETKILIENFMKNGLNFNEKLTRAKFEQLNMKLFMGTLKPINKVLKDSNMQKGDIDEIVLVGGSTRIPKVQEILVNYFGGKKLHKEIDPDEAVSYGAGIQGAIINRIISSENTVLLVDVNALSLGVETAGGAMSVIIPRNSQIPCKKSETYTTSHNNQQVIKIPVYEGERKKARQNRLLGEFELSGIPKAPKGIPKITITFELDTNGILSCTAKEESTGSISKQTFVKGTLSDEEIKKMKLDAQLNNAKDIKQIRKIKLIQMFEEFINFIKTSITKPEVKSNLDSKELKNIKHAIFKASKWIRKFKQTAKFQQIEKQFNAFKNYITPILMLDLDEDDQFSITAIDEQIEKEYGTVEDIIQTSDNDDIDNTNYDDISNDQQQDYQTEDDQQNSADDDIDIDIDDDEDDEPFFNSDL